MSNSLSHTQLTLRALRDRGLVCAIAGPHGIRQDLFRIIDVLAVDPQQGVIGVQSTGTDFAGHKKKLLENPKYKLWFDPQSCQFLESRHVAPRRYIT